MIRELYTELLALVAEEEGKEDHRHKHWVKHVTGVNASCATGYAFKGDFVKEGTVEVEGPGVYLVCTRRGSMKYQTATYNVVLMGREGKLTLLGIRTDDKKKGWALRIRDQVADWVTQIQGNVEEKPIVVALTYQAHDDLVAIRDRLGLTEKEIVAAALAKYRIHVDAHLGASAVGKLNARVARGRASESALTKAIGREASSDD